MPLTTKRMHDDKTAPLKHEDVQSIHYPTSREAKLLIPHKNYSIYVNTTYKDLGSFFKKTKLDNKLPGYGGPFAYHDGTEYEG